MRQVARDERGSFSLPMSLVWVLGIATPIFIYLSIFTDKNLWLWALAASIGMILMFGFEVFRQKRPEGPQQ